MPRNRVVAIPFLSVKEMLDISIIFCIKNLFSLSVSDIMTNLAVSTITKALTKQIIIKLMKITQFRKNEDTIALSVMDLDISSISLTERNGIATNLLRGKLVFSA